MTIREDCLRSTETLENLRAKIAEAMISAAASRESPDEAAEALRRATDRLNELLDHLEAEQHWLTHAQADLDVRLQNLERSIVWRTLRAVGRLFARVQRAVDPSVGKREEARLRNEYIGWLAGRAALEPAGDRLARERARWDYRPLISVVVGGGISRAESLPGFLQSLQQQSYENWRLDALASGSSSPEMRSQLAEFGDRRLGAAFAPASGTDADYIVFIEAHHRLHPHAFHYLAQAVQQERPDLIYSDEQYLDADGNPMFPLFKPDWSPTLRHAAGYLDGMIAVSSNLYSEVLTPPPPERAELLDRVAMLNLTARHIPLVLNGRLKHFEKASGSGADRRATNDSAPGKSVSIVICSRNPKLLRHCLSSFATTENRKTTFVVVHHEIPGESAAAREIRELIQQHGCQRIPYVGPFNFSRMCNRAAEASSSDYLCFLNDDMEPLSSDWLNRMMTAAESASDVGAVGAKLLYPDGTIQHAGVTVGAFRAGHIGRYATANPYWPWLNHDREVTAVTGACLLTRRRTFEELGGFDESYPTNYSDVDYCLRARKAGLRVLFMASARLEHKESQSRLPGVGYEERQRFFYRWADELVRPDPYYNPNLRQGSEIIALNPEERAVASAGMV